MKRILIIPPHKWYMEANAEYLIRYLSDEFFMEIAQVPYEPYTNFLSRFPNENPFMRSPDDYDLIWPLLPTHWHIDKDKYRHKVATVFYCPNEGEFTGVAAIGATTPRIEEAFKESNTPYHSLRFGIDTNLFRPYKMVREDNLLHVGMVGTLGNSRRLVTAIVPALKKIPGVRLMLFLNMSPRDQKELSEVGGDLNLIEGGDKWWPGLPNIYNQLDVLLRIDHDPGYAFPALEAAACGVPSIMTDCGIEHLLAKAGAGKLIEGDRAYYMNNQDKVAKEVVEKVIWMRDNPTDREQMGWMARKEIEAYWTWDKHIDNWRKFFRKGLYESANKNMG